MNYILVCPTNLNFMPYFDLFYKASNCEVIIWDRFGIEPHKIGRYVYRDKKNGHRRGLIDYLLFIIFVYKTILPVKNSKKFVIFGFQTTFFLSPLLVFLKNKYVVDIRDHHILQRFTPSFVFDNASFVSVSSPGYKDIFSTKAKVLISHNYQSIDFFFDTKRAKSPFIVSCIGAIRDLKANSLLIKKLANNQDFMVNFNGLGVAVDELKNLAHSINATNIFFTGQYNKEDEVNYYVASDMINILRDSISYNDRIALPNRLYNCISYKIPMLCFRGTLLADIVETYNLGLCLNLEDDLPNEIIKYFESFNIEAFVEGGATFMKIVLKEQAIFELNLKRFFNSH